MHLKGVLFFLLPLWASVTAVAALPPGCTGSASLGSIQLSVRPFSAGAPLPLKAVAEIPGGSRLIWNPIHLTAQTGKDAEVTAVLVPVSAGDLITLEPRKASSRTEWQLPERPHVIALLFGPQGLSEGRILSLVTRNRELLRELADYAEQSSEVETLVQQLANAEQSGNGTDAALKGISAQYGAGAPKLNTKASSNDQAALLLKAILPASNAYDPLAARSTQAQQSGGLAASVAGMFFGNPVALATGGAALFTNLKTAMFPGTDFRSAFAQFEGPDEMALCTKNLALPKSKMRSVYLWAYRVPEIKKPTVSLAGTPHLPLGSHATVALKFSRSAAPSTQQLSLAREWRLIPIGGGVPIPVDVRVTAAESVDLDLAKPKLTSGGYYLAATWDWDTLLVSGTLDVRPYADFAAVKLAPGENRKLIHGSGVVPVTFRGADFEFLERAVVESTPDAKPFEEPFHLPLGRGRGTVHLALTQSDGVAHDVPMTILPPNPRLSGLPIRLHLGDPRQVLRLDGDGLVRIESISSDAGTITGKPHGGAWLGQITLNNGLTKGQRFSLRLKLTGLDEPVSVPDAVEIAGPRPRIRAAQKSLSGAPGVEIAPNELPEGTEAGLVLTVEGLDEESQPRLELACAEGSGRALLTISPNETSGGARLTLSGPDALYLSFDPAAVGYAGCRMAATVATDADGRSDPFVLGRVLRVPRLEKLTLTNQKVGDASYAGSLEGRDLDVIQKVGWDAGNGLPVDAIPAPVPGDPARQSLQIALPWPAPAPHAQLYIWLRGETTGRKTTVTY
jgi:hypothetical protein